MIEDKTDGSGTKDAMASNEETVDENGIITESLGPEKLVRLRLTGVIEFIVNLTMCM